jgi:hypothetical protein
MAGEIDEREQGHQSDDSLRGRRDDDEQSTMAVVMKTAVIDFAFSLYQPAGDIDSCAHIPCQSKIATSH